ncbi:anti-sigma factor family protein [Sinomonas susongensis]|uniref:anti-sigma factor family protein n=1 Tax=Sinomonas susongensis TaxID=1324851 RepID=UPI0011090580|nr:zf-HC2 domain-containing protein [Sinomonas susongensis]
MTLHHHEARLALGAYLLGALDQEEARAVEAHLSTCPDCRAEVEGLETLPALLDAVPPSRAVMLGDAPVLADVPTALADTPAPPALLARVRARRRALRLRWTGALAGAAAASLALGVALGPVVEGAGEQRPGPTAAQSPSTSPAASYSLTSSDGAEVDLTLVRKGWGTELDLVCREMPSAGVFSVWVVADDGAQERAASWSSTGYAGRAVVTGATSYQLASIRSIQIRDDAQHTLASVSVAATPPG